MTSSLKQFKPEILRRLSQTSSRNSSELSLPNFRKSSKSSKNPSLSNLWAFSSEISSEMLTHIQRINLYYLSSMMGFYYRYFRKTLMSLQLRHYSRPTLTEVKLAMAFRMFIIGSFFCLDFYRYRSRQVISSLRILI